MKIAEIITEKSTKSGRGPKQGWKNYCRNTPRNKMSASWRSSCVSRGLISRDTGKSQLRSKDGKRVKLDGKKAASTKHGGWVSPTKTG